MCKEIPYSIYVGAKTLTQSTKQKDKQNGNSYLRFTKRTGVHDMNNLFEEFQGADIERLVDCLAAIRKAGLSVDKYTHAGVNHNSGNVWVWSEDWAGAVACSIGFYVFWLYSCPKCGEEFEFETYQELEAFAEDNREDCTMCRTEEVTA